MLDCDLPRVRRNLPKARPVTADDEERLAPVILLDSDERDQVPVRGEVRVGVAAAVASREWIPGEASVACAISPHQPDAIVARPLGEIALVDDPFAVR